MTNTKRTSKQTQLLRAARELISRYGFRRVTVEEICRKAAVSKMTFYKHYANKTAIAQAVIRDIFDAMRHERDEALRQDASLAWKVERIIEMEMDLSTQIGEEFVQDFFQSPELQPLMTEIMEEGYAALEGLYRQGQASGEVRQDVDIRLMMYMTRQLYLVMQDSTIVSNYATLRDFSRELICLYFYGVLSRGDEGEGV